MICPKCGGDLEFVTILGDGWNEPSEYIYKCEDCCYGDFECERCKDEYNCPMEEI